MSFFQIIKGLFLAFFGAWRNLWRGSGKTFRLITALIAVVLVIAVITRQYRSAFVDRPPGWLQQKEFNSPPLSAPSWMQFQQLLEQAQRYAEQYSVPLGF